MQINELWIENFRNYQKEKVEFGPSLNLIIGENAQGKTNLLEAVLFLSTGRSHRSNKEEEFINWEKDYFYLKGIYSTSRGETTLEVSRSVKEKKLKINKVEEKKLTNFLGLVNAVIFSPEDLRIVKESPGERRRFLNILISQLYPKYYSYLQQYRKILVQRNNLLRQIRKGDCRPGELEVWDEQLVETGSKIIEMRLNLIEKLEPLAQSVHKRITEEREQFSIAYQPSIFPIEKGKIRESFFNALFKFRGEEIFRGVSMIGPHRDDFNISIDNRSVRTYGSQGQQRTAALTIKMAEIEMVKDVKGEYPLFLLDDVMSELDQRRQAFLMETIGEKLQAVITSTDLKPFPNLKHQSTDVFTVKHGKVRKVYN